MKLKSASMSLSNSQFLLLIILSLFLANTVQSQAPDVTSFQIDSFNPTSDGLTYERDAFVPSGTSYLRLIGTDASGNPRTSSVGRVLYSKPVRFWDGGRQASFETTIRLAITPVDNDPVDGLTFFIVPGLLPQQVQVGISASTGPTRVCNFDVFSWYFTSTMVADNNFSYIKKYAA
ncbi:hypothetical protein ACS0TY_015424 [Phlomoides rotata]